MNVKVGEIESTASVRTRDRTRRPQKVGLGVATRVQLWGLFLHLLKFSPVPLLKSVSSQV